MNVKRLFVRKTPAKYALELADMLVGCGSVIAVVYLQFAVGVEGVGCLSDE